MNLKGKLSLLTVFPNYPICNYPSRWLMLSSLNYILPVWLDATLIYLQIKHTLIISANANVNLLHHTNCKSFYSIGLSDRIRTDSTGRTEMTLFYLFNQIHSTCLIIVSPETTAFHFTGHNLVKNDPIPFVRSLFNEEWTWTNCPTVN